MGGGAGRPGTSRIPPSLGYCAGWYSPSARNGAIGAERCVPPDQVAKNSTNDKESAGAPGGELMRERAIERCGHRARRARWAGGASVRSSPPGGHGGGCSMAELCSLQPPGSPFSAEVRGRPAETCASVRGPAFRPSSCFLWCQTRFLSEPLAPETLQLQGKMVQPLVKTKIVKKRTKPFFRNQSDRHLRLGVRLRPRNRARACLEPRDKACRRAIVNAHRRNFLRPMPRVCIASRRRVDRSGAANSWADVTL